MAFKRFDFQRGRIDDDPLSDTASSFTSTELADLPAVSDPDRVKLTFDPEEVNGDAEIVYVTEHASSSEVATVLREQEGTTKREHSLNTRWEHSPTAKDVQDAQYPPSVIMAYGGTTAPDDNWLLCDGTFHDQSDYPDLFNQIGHNFNAGNDPGDGTFKVPDLRGRVMVTLDNLGGTAANVIGDAQAAVLGGVFGEDLHALAISELPSHSHGGNVSTTNANPVHAHNAVTNVNNVGNHDHFTNNTGGHSHPVKTQLTADAGGDRNSPVNQNLSGTNINSGNAGNHEHNTDAAGAQNINAATNIGNSNATHSHSVTLTEQGDDEGHENKQPSMAVGAIIHI